MGARQRAQNRAKNGRGNNKGSVWSEKRPHPSPQGTQMHDLDPSARHKGLKAWQDYSTSSSPRNGFSMSQEARNTERHVFGWGATKLRDNAVAFVSAGNLVREDPQEGQEQREDNTDLPESGKPSDPVAEATVLEREALDTDVPVEKSAVDNCSIGKDSSYKNPDIGNYRPRKDSSSSSASDEVIFAGRQNPPKIPMRAVEPVKSAKLLGSEDPTVGSESIDILSQPVSVQVSQLSTSSEVQTSGDPRKLNSRYRRKEISSHRKWMIDEEEAIMQDYIANMAMDDDDSDDSDDDEKGDKVDKSSQRNEHYRFHVGADSENVKVQTKSAHPTYRSARRVDQAADWSSADLEDFDDLSTTDDEITEIGQVLRHRVRPSGAQYLVAATGKGASDAKWMAREKLTSATAAEEIRIFEAIKIMKLEEGSDVSDSSSSEDEDALEDLVGNIQSEDEENLRIMEHTSRMTDEQIAQALAKQEELGMGADELMLFDGQVGDEDEEELEGDDFQHGDDFIPFSTKKHVSNRGKTKRNRRQRDSFPSAAAFADALDEDPYGAFDVMDFDRPSLRPRPKGRKSDFPFDLELEDDDLAEQLRSTWTKDREKKTARKRAKEEAQQAAVLGDSERSDPMVIKDEIRRFMIEEADTLKLAPMASITRASVHRLAKALKLSSRSEGKDGVGAGRYPVLTKTAYTPHYTLDSIWEIDALLSLRKFFPKVASSSYGGAKASRNNDAGTRNRRGGGGVMSGATYMNGEIVGASAPEIGAENKGRAMLEKMGWSSGMGIGAVGNKGSVEVIKHVVKTTKAGLG